MSATRVLIVDDSALMRSVVQTLLEPNGFACEQAGDGQRALDAFTHFRPEIVILDIDLPDASGLSLLKAFKAHDPTVKVLMLSANAYRANVLTANADGASDFVAKPVDVTRLLRSVQALAATR